MTKVLVTGSGGFLGRSVVLALRRRGYEVRALLRRESRLRGEQAPPGVEECDADVRDSSALGRACQGVQAVVHLAARMRGEDEVLLSTAVQGTERLIDEMEKAGVERMVLASSLSVYDWGAAEGTLHEDSPLETRPEMRDAYTASKILQEQIARDRCGRHGIALTILRPGAIWGPGREYPPTIGQRVGPFHVVIGGARQLPVVHVENCADAFAVVLDSGTAAQGTFNVIDAPHLTARQFVRDYLQRTRRLGAIVPAAYDFSLTCAKIVHRIAPGALRRRLPRFLGPARFAARYKPLRIDGTRLVEALGWRPPLSYEECLERTYGRFQPLRA